MITLRFHEMSSTVDVRWVRMAGIVNMKEFGPRVHLQVAYGYVIYRVMS